MDLLIALNSGMPGMCSVHANSAHEAVVKLCTLPLLAGPNVTSGFVVPTVAGAIDLVVHVATDADGRRRVREVVELTGVSSDGGVQTRPIYRHDVTSGTSSEPAHLTAPPLHLLGGGPRWQIA